MSLDFCACVRERARVVEPFSRRWKCFHPKMSLCVCAFMCGRARVVELFSWALVVLSAQNEPACVCVCEKESARGCARERVRVTESVCGCV